MKNLKIIFLIMLVFSLSFCFACSSGGGKNGGEVHTVDNIIIPSDGGVENVKVKFDVANFGTFTVETYAESAPQSVARFLELVKAGYYNDMEFEAIYPGEFMTSSGKTALSSGEITDTIPGEFMANGYSNELALTRGTLVFSYMPGEYNSATDKFMILLGDNPEFNGKYAGFAKVVDGDTVFSNIASAPIKADNTPVLPIVMKKVYIDE